MAGGLGTRLGAFTRVLPKPLLPLGEHSILEIILLKLKSCGFNEIFITTYYKPELLEAVLGNGSKYGVSIIYSREDKPLGTAGAIKLLQKHLTEPFLVINGDILTNLNFGEVLKFHQQKNADFTLVTKEMELPMDYGVVYSNEEGIIHKIEEKPKVTTEINAGIYVLSPHILEHLPENEHVLMTDLLQKLIARKDLKVFKFPNKEYWLDMGRAGDYEKAQEDFENGKISLR